MISIHPKLAAGGYRLKSSIYSQSFADSSLLKFSCVIKVFTLWRSSIEFFNIPSNYRMLKKFTNSSYLVCQMSSKKGSNIAPTVEQIQCDAVTQVILSLYNWSGAFTIREGGSLLNKFVFFQI